MAYETLLAYLLLLLANLTIHCIVYQNKRRTFSRGQASVEVISYVGVFMLAIAALMAYFYPEWTTNNRVNTAQVTVKDIKNTIDDVYNSGPGTRQTITVNIPSGVVMAQSSENKVVMRLTLPGDKTTDVIEVTDAPIKGSIPRAEGIHKIVIEYSESGVVSVGSALSLTPAFVEVETTPKNTTNFTITAENNGDTRITNIELNVFGQSSDWISLNETAFTLERGEVKDIRVSIETPDNILPVSYTNYVVAECSQEYAEATTNILVGGVSCGNTIIEDAEECETLTPFIFPQENNPNCPNQVTEPVCDAENQRYRKSLDEYGKCTIGCVCQDDAVGSWVLCGENCQDPEYCMHCSHCFDGVRNCNEDGVDEGGPCGGSCDGVDDIAEGSPCTLGQQEVCGGDDCTGTKTCISAGRFCVWNGCSTYGTHCQTNKCCTCSADVSNPQKTTDTSPQMSFTDCPGTETTCGDATSCSGGRYGYECTGLNTCELDLDGSTVAVVDDASKCNGQTCAPTAYSCFDQAYPCNGEKTPHLCQSGSCNAQAPIEDDTSCAGIGSCNAPPEIILTKLDKGFAEYIDAPSSAGGCLGVFMGDHSVCNRTSSYFIYTTGFYNTEEGAYYPYRNGLLKFYTFGRHEDQQHHQYQDCAFQCGNEVRIGTDENNWKEWSFTSPTQFWTRKIVNLSSTPKATKGSVDWNNIGYIYFKTGAGWRGGDHLSDCGGALDYVTLSLQ